MVTALEIEKSLLSFLFFENKRNKEQEKKIQKMGGTVQKMTAALFSKKDVSWCLVFGVGCGVWWLVFGLVFGCLVFGCLCLVFGVWWRFVVWCFMCPFWLLFGFQFPLFFRFEF